ncbi:MAG TPA: glutamine--tRNA ligase/YqeY domain fusion protein [Smithellaceae bacterium]|nr:glutamine--tRNA ligase/YqeY domain fusion protein [Smithellaceae bacterium]HQF83793.1 glutamine--tRNA ligase/YqeY domain fusion protein [Smithellaceae bacterium]HQG80063.1 glutamine--tRNA ligase/YqeY domain fusion protein [Smithellaceae bacterium]
MTENDISAPTDFIREIIDEDLQTNKHEGRVATRFPPEPNGYIHIGHAKSVCLNFGLAKQYGGTCNLRLDDTDPAGESMEYVESIIRDVRWLGFDWGERLFYASDYFEKLYRFAVELIKRGEAYVCSLTPAQIREYRGSFTEPGRESPYRNRSVKENLDLFARMRAGEFADGSHVLRAKIDMAAPNVVMRDPVIYRIKRETHYRTGDQWVIYPMYDFAHCLSDALERITHSICTLEFENNRPLYDWIVERLIPADRPRQIEFARLNVSYTVLSKRRLIELVNDKHVQGWDDPRMPTVSGMRRRGYTPEAIRDFCQAIGVAKNDNLVDVALLEHCVRDDLNDRAPRAMCVLHPLKVVIVNYPEGQSEEFDFANHPQKPELGTRKVTFSRELYIERDDFMADPPKKYNRLGPGREVRLRNSYVIRFQSMERDEKTGEVTQINCTYDPATRNAPPADGRKVQGVIHWVCAGRAVPAEVRLYDRLFTVEDPGSMDNFLDYLNPNSLEVLTGCYAEPGLKNVPPGTSLQFERLGYFCADEKDSKDGRLVFNRVVSLRDSWAKIAAKG